MTYRYLLLTAVLLWGVISHSFNQETAYPLTVQVTIDEQAQGFDSNGRLFLMLTQNPEGEPRTRIWPNADNHIFAKNFNGLDATMTLTIQGAEDWDRTSSWTLEQVPVGTYYVQALWDQDKKESRINAPGNWYSPRQKVDMKEPAVISLELSEQIGPRQVVEHPLVRSIDLTSDTLSGWWGKPVHLKATVLLPSKYEANPDRPYPIRYNVAGYGGRYTRINRLVKDKSFMEWWQSDQAPQIINVFLDGEGPFGDSYQMDSDNNGPYGHALIYELIPHIEAQYRNTTTAATRFVDGCSTGGWVSLGLQLYYPQMFNGVFSYSPDAIEYTNYQLINVYEDENAFVNEHGYERPVWRDTDGEPKMSLQDFIRYENVLGSSGTFVTSGGQFSAHNALYSPKGKNGLPAAIFDPVTGKINKEIAEHWKQYDFLLHTQENWAELGPELQGKIYIWMGDMDEFYLNLATRKFADYLATTTNPRSDAEIVFAATEGHCDAYNYRRVLEQIQARLAELGRYER